MQASNSSQAGRLTPRDSPQASQEDSALPLSTNSQADNPQALLADSTLSLGESAISQAGSSQSSQAGNSQSSPGESTLSQAGSPPASPVDNTPSLAESELYQASNSQSSLEDSTLSQSNFSQAGSSQASPADSTLSPAESELYLAGNSQSSPDDSALPQSDISQAGSSQASPADSTLSLAESELYQASSSQDSTLQVESTVLPQAVKHSARLRASQARQAGSFPSQAGTTPRVDTMVSQPDSTVPLVAFPQAIASQEARAFPNRHNTPQGSSPLEEPDPKWVINLSSKPLTPAQRSVLAKGPNFVVTPRHLPNLEYITAIEAACTKLSQQNAEELRADINQVLRASHPP